MSKATEPILELLSEASVAMNPSGIIYELEQRMDDPPGKSTVYRALETLTNVGYIDQPVEPKSLYKISKSGEEWLAGKRDAADDAPE